MKRSWYSFLTLTLSNICTILFCAARFIHNVRFSSTLDKDAIHNVTDFFYSRQGRKKKKMHIQTSFTSHACLHIPVYTYCTPGTYYVLTAVVFLAQLQREIASKTNAVLLLLYSYLKKKEEDNLHGINCTYRIDIERYTSTCMQGCSSHMKRKAIFIRKKITCMYYLYNQLHIQVLICLYIN